MTRAGGRRAVVGGAVALACVGLVAACANEVDVVTDGGTGSAATGASSSSGGPTTHVLEIAGETDSPDYDDDVVVLHNRPDGELVAAWRVSNLPIVTTVTDGDLVTYAYASQLGTRAFSYRVTPSLERVFHNARPLFLSKETCAKATMHVLLHLPAVPGVGTVKVRTYPAAGLLFDDDLPLDADLEVTACEGTSSFDLFAYADDGFYTILGFHLEEGVPFVAGSTLELTVPLPNEPRKTLAIDVGDTASASTLRANTSWASPQREFFAVEPHDLMIANPTPLVYALPLVDMPGGEPYARVELTLPPTSSACARGSRIERHGRSDVPVPFDADALAEPLLANDVVSLGAGLTGDVIVRSFELGEKLTWWLHEDALEPSRPAVFPVLPADVPKQLQALPLPPRLTGVTHVDVEELADFEAFAAEPLWMFPRTARQRSVEPCP